MSLGRTTTFLDIYFERDLAAGVLTEEQAQEIIDDFVIKLRIVRFLRTPEYDDLFAGDPTWVTESHRRDGRRRALARDQDQLPHSADALQPRPGTGAQSDHLVLATAARWLPPLRRQGRDRHQLPPVRERRDHAPRLGRRRRHRLLRVADARRQADAVLRRPRQSREVPPLRHQRRARRDQRRADWPGVRAGQGRLPRVRRRGRRSSRR